MNLIHRLEPLWWLLFGAGGFAAALILPGLLFGVGIAAPLGWFSEDATSYHRMHGLVSNPLGKLILTAVLSLVYWHSAHHLRHFALDMGLAKLEAPISYTLYALALVCTIATFSAIGSL